MARTPLAQRIAQLEEQAKTLKARLANQERAKDTRRKILIGAFVLYRIEQNSGHNEFYNQLADWLRRDLPGFLTREEDKKLFTDLLGADADSTTPIMTDDDQISES